MNVAFAVNEHTQGGRYNLLPSNHVCTVGVILIVIIILICAHIDHVYIDVFCVAVD